MSTAGLLNHRYKTIKALAEGGFGKTFLAEDTQMPSRRKCVIKLLKPLSSRPEVAKIVQERFTREAAVLDSVGKRHDQIPTLYAYFVSKGQFYLVQEWIDGEPLYVAEHKVWPQEKVHKLLLDLLSAIAHIHRLNVIHRDIKPDNIILRKADGLPCLIDFGAVKEVMSTVVSPGGTPKSSIVIGTAGYMPKEQAAGRPTFSSDLYSLAMTAICLLIGKPPAAIPSDSLTGELLWKPLVPDIDPTFAQILSQAVHTYPQQRYTTAADLFSALKGLASGSATLPPPPTLAHNAATLPPPPGPVLQPPIQPLTQPPIQSPMSEPMPTPMQQTPINLPVARPPSKFPLAAKSTALAVSGLALGGALLVGVRPMLNFDDSLTSTATQAVSNSDASGQSAETRSTADVPSEPETAEDFTQRATLLQQQGQEQQALEDIEAALALDPDAVDASILKGDILANQSRVDLPGAIAAYTQALSADPDNPDALEKRCKTYQQNQDWNQAEQDCSQLLSIQPNNALIYDRRGDIRSAQKNYEAAIEDYTKAIQINENNGNAAANRSIYYSRGTAYGEIGDPEKGLADYERFRAPTL
ncbi:MAG: tetratricopeptide repeat protein [Cyanobacteria bacterium J06559_1]